jgi:hypothetical protein
MFHIIRAIIEFALKYLGLGILIALGAMLIVLLLLSERKRVTRMLKIRAIKEKFDQLCEISDRLDEPYMSRHPLGNALWLTSLIWKGIILEVVILVLWGLVRAAG